MEVPVRHSTTAALLSLPFLVLAPCFPVAAQALKGPEAAVRAHLRALNEGDSLGLFAGFSREAKIFALPTDPDRLAGNPSDPSFFHATLARRPLQRTELLHHVVLGELVVAKLKISDPPDDAKAYYVLTVFRVRDGLIHDLYHVARADSALPQASVAAREVIERLVVVNNRGDVGAFLALFSPDSKYFRGSDDPHGLADRASKTVYDQESRRKAFTAMFAKGSPAQVEIVSIFAVGDLVMSRDRATLPTGKVLDEITIYRVRNGLITHDWFVLVLEQ
jgi:hypothetical protein